MTDERFLLKDFFNRETIGIIAAAVADASTGFDRRAFLDAVFDEDWGERELKQRMRHVATCLRAPSGANRIRSHGLGSQHVREPGRLGYRPGLWNRQLGWLLGRDAPWVTSSPTCCAEPSAG